MASEAQRAAARKNIKKAQAALREEFGTTDPRVTTAGGRRRSRNSADFAENPDRAPNARRKRGKRGKRARKRAARKASPRKAKRTTTTTTTTKTVRKSRGRRRAAAPRASRKQRRSPAQKRASRANIKKAQAKRRRGGARKPSRSRGRRRAAAKRPTRRTRARSRKVSERVVRVSGGRGRKRVVVDVQPTRRRSAGKRRGRGRSRSRNPMENSVDFMDNPEFVENIQEYLDNPEDFDDNPGIGGLVSNQGPFGREQLMGYLAAAGGVAFGLIVADFVDRFVATRRPRDSEGTTPGQMVKGLNPWYGRNAAAAIRMRPDAMRLGVQALGAIGSMAAAYFTRNVRIVPWLLGGAAIGFGSNLMKQLVDWYLMPFLFKVDKPDEVSLANRLYSLEQPAVQDEISRLFTNWAQVPNLSAQQLDPIPAGAIQSPLTIGKGQLPAAGQSAIALAGTPQRDPQPQPLVAAGNRGVGHANGQRQKMATGRLGMCSSCGGGGGGGANGWCWSDCPDLCSSCGEQMAAADMCRIVVQDGWPVTLLNGLITATGANPADVARANSWADLNAVATAWRPGAEIVLPNVVCMAIHRAKARGLSNEQAILSVAEGFNTGNGAQPFMVSPAVAGLAPPMVGAVPEREREPEPVRANTAPAAPAAVAGPPAEAPAPAPTPKYDPVEERMARFELRPD